MTRGERTGWTIVVLSTIAMTVALRSRQEANIWIATGVVAAAALIAVAVFDRPRMMEMLKIRSGSISWGIATGLLFIVLTHAVTRAAFAIDPRARELVDRLYASIQDPPGAVAAFPVIALVAFMEEVVWRGVLVDLLKKQKLGAAFVLAVLIYSIPQFLDGNLALAFAAIGCGSVWTALRLWRDDVVTPFVNHVIWNLGVFVVVPLR